MSDRTVSAYQRRDSGRQGKVIDAIIERASGIDTDILAVMDKRDTTMIEEEIMHGAGSSKYVYAFSVSGKAVTGVSVVGARELATHYGGMQHEILASVSKVDKLLIITQYPQDGVPMDIRFQRVPELEDEPDFYECLIRVKDIKTGNSTQARKREYRMEERSEALLQKNPGLDRYYARPHYDTIAESKAYRNAILTLIPQGVQIKWKLEMMKLEKADVITVSVIDEKRSGVLRYAASKAIPVDREAIEALTFDQIAGLSDAVREGRAEQFMQAADALGIVLEGDTDGRVDRKVLNTPATTTKPSTQNRQDGNTTGQTDQQQGSKTREQKPKKEDQQGISGGKAKPVEDEKKVETKPVDGVKAQADQTGEIAAGFDHYPLDEFGEPLADANGELTHFTDARAFALWYNDRFSKSPNPEALKENNEDARQEAMQDVAAKVILDAVDNPIDTSKPVAEEKPEEVKKDEAPKPLAPATLPNNRVNWPKYANDCEAALKAMQSEPEIDAWLVLNSPTYTGKAISATVEKHVKAKRAAIAAAAQPQQDRDMEMALDVIRQLDEVTFQHEYDQILSNGAIRVWTKRMSTERQDIRDMVGVADKAAQHRIKQKTEGQAQDRRTQEEPPPAGEDGIPWDRMAGDQP